MARSDPDPARYRHHHGDGEHDRRARTRHVIRCCGEMQTIIEQLPEAATKVTTTIARVIVKVISQHVEQLHPMAELLGD